MQIQGYTEYKTRTFCNDVKCPIQMELNSKKADSEEYLIVKQKCDKCGFSARQFHHWLIEKGYAIIKPDK